MLSLSRRLGLTLLLALGVACGGNLAAAQDSPQDGVSTDTINIGIIVDQTGPSNSVQVPWLRGVETQINKINEAGGVNGRKFKLLITDDRFEVPTSITAFKRYASQTPVLAILGLNSTNQAAAADLIRQSGIPVLSLSTQKPAAVPFNPSLYAMMPTYDAQVDVLLARVYQRLGRKNVRVAMVRNETASPLEIEALVKARLEKTGGTYLGSIVVPNAATNADAQAQQIVDMKPDVVLPVQAASGVALFIRALQKLDFKVPMISTFGSGNAAVFESVQPEYGSLFEYVHPMTPVGVDVPGAKQLEADAAKYGFAKEAADVNFRLGYVEGAVLIEAVKNAGKALTRKSLHTALDNIKDFDTGRLSANVSFSPTNHFGILLTRPIGWDYEKRQFKVVGDFEDYKSSLSYEYGGK